MSKDGDKPFGIDLTKLDAKQLRTLMKNARDREREDVRDLAFRQLCAIGGANVEIDLAPDDPLARRYWEALTAAEELKTEERGRTTRLQRTRNKMAKVGIVQTMSDLALKSPPSDGFHILVDGGMPQLVFEYVIVEFPDRFPADVVAASRARLIEYEIPAPGAH